MRYSQIIILFLVLIGLLFAGYSNSFYTPYHFDDSVNIIRNENIHMKSFDWENIKNTFFAGGTRGNIYHPILYRPVVMFSLAMNYFFAGNIENTFGFHIVNFIIHSISTLFLFLFILKVLQLPKVKTDNATMIAFLATALWSLNPLHLTAVTYITQRMTSMAGMFVIITMYFYLKARTANNIKYAVLAFVFFILGVMSKENAIMVFLAIGIFDCMFIENSNIKLNLAIFLWITIIAILLIYAVQGHETFSYETLKEGYAKRDFTLGQRLLTEPRVIVFYLMLLFFPSHNLMSLTHDVPISKGILSPPETLFSMIIIVCLIGLAMARSRKNPLFSYAILFFFLNHVIEGTIFPLELVYEHRNYVPSMFLFVPISILLAKAFIRYRIPTAILASIIIGFFMINLYEQNTIWKTDLHLWADTTKKSPDPRSVYNLAGAYYVLKQYDKALKYWTISAKFNELFGTNYSESERVIPYGRVMAMAGHNAKMLTMEKEGKIRPAWKVNQRFLDKVVIQKASDG